MNHPASQRAVWPDYAKGLCIILIVAIHTIDGVFRAGVGTPTPLWNMIHDLGYAFMVNVFFVLSGYFAQQSMTKSGWRHGLHSVTTGLLYPYLLWTTIQTSLAIVFKGGNNVFAWSDFPGCLLNGSMQFWFLHALIIIYIMDMVLQACRISAFIRFILSCCVFLIGWYTGPLRYRWLNEFSGTYLFFTIGCIAGHLRLRRPSAPQLVAGCIGGFSVLFICCSSGAGFNTPLQLCSTLGGITGCLSLCAMLPVSSSMNWLAIVGFNSLQLYCAHVIFASTARAALLHFGCRNFLWHCGVGLTAAMGLSLVAAAVDRKHLGFLFRLPKPGLARPKTQSICSAEPSHIG
ncbi:MAG TPA: acyltransferase [Verrucomicrobiae bacterium]|nr:acyltransferase [Verrucomicrobiae bacterium]